MGTAVESSSSANQMSVLMVSANIGSIFEEPDTLLKTWITEFLDRVKKFNPKFIAVHCQEVGGKNYEDSMRHVDQFLRMLISSEDLSMYNRNRVYVDEDFTCSENFTALGNLYFIHEDVDDVHIWDFSEDAFVTVYDKIVHSGNIEDVSTKEKQKFPQEFFPECKWSRKGFMRTRWNLCGTVFDLINIHLFHDASNFVAMESFPSSYSENRRRALDYTVRKSLNESSDQVPFFIFGDFNFRLNTQGVVKKLTQKTVPLQVKEKNGELQKLVYAEDGSSEKAILTIEKKVFDYIDHTNRFMAKNGEWLEFDLELKPFSNVLHEYDISFPPSYPYSEDSSNPNLYMKTRCPAWCDRIFLSKKALNLVSSCCDGDDDVVYQVMGSDVCMGDHKPVFLSFNMEIRSSGTCIVVTKSSRLSRSNSANFKLSRKTTPDLFATSVSQNNLLKPPIPHLRFISHHSSSCEEWYDNVKPLKRQDAIDRQSNESLCSHDSLVADTDVIKTGLGVDYCIDVERYEAKNVDDVAFKKVTGNDRFEPAREANTSCKTECEKIRCKCCIIQ